MWTPRRRYSGLGLLVLIFAGALAVAWLLLNHVAFATVVLSFIFAAVLFWTGWDSWRQTTPESLQARGMNPDDRKLAVFDPGLRRGYPAILPFALGRTTVKTSKPREAAPPAGPRPPAG